MKMEPNFLKQSSVAEDGLSATGVVVFDPEYPAIRSRDGRVNQAECLHACWNLAHVMAKGWTKLRAGDTRIVSHYEAKAGRQYQIQATAQIRMLGFGNFEAIIKDGEQIICEIKTLFYAE